MTDPIGIDFLRGIVMRAPQITDSSAFYTETWGLQHVATEEGTVYLRGTSPEPYIYGLTDGEDFGIEYVNFGMTSRARLESLYDRLQNTNVPIVSEPQTVSTPGGGFGFCVRDPDNRILRIVAEVTPNENAEETFAMPSKVSHVVLNTPDIKETEAFYCDKLGFRLSDYYVDRMSFLRCSTDHHSIALVQNKYPAVNHVAFEMPGIDSFMRGIGRMKLHRLANGIVDRHAMHRQPPLARRNPGHNPRTVG